MRLVQNKKEEIMVKIPQIWFKNHDHTDERSSANFKTINHAQALHN